MKTKQIGILEYAQKINPEYFRKNRANPNEPVTQQAVKYRIKNNMELPEVLKYERVGKIHVLRVRHDF